MNILRYAMLVALIASTAQLIPRFAIAAEDGYLILRGGYGWSDDVTRKGTDKQTLVQYDNIGNLGLAYGRSMGWLRMEAEFSYLHVAIDNVSRTDGFTLNGSGQDRHYTFMANAFADWDNETVFTPFVGGGLGAAYVNHDVIFTRPNRNNTIVSDDHTWSFAYQLMAGVSWSINPRWSMEMMYRYYQIDDREHEQTGSTRNDVPTVNLDPHEIHLCLIGLQYSF